MGKQVVHVCPHCAEIAVSINACGALQDANSQHYAMALIRALKAEGRTLDEAVEFLALIEDAEELKPSAAAPRRAPTPYPSIGAGLILGRGEQNV